jgi:type I restriction enzyme M protein
MLTAETKRRIDSCRDVLVGKLPLPTDQVELIILTLIYKFMDDLDEESVKLGGKRSFFIGELAKYRWRNLLPQTVSAEERVTLFSEGIEALGSPKKAAHLPGLFRDIFRNAFLKFRDGRILTMFLTEVNGLAYSHSEELGNAFEYLLQCMGTQGGNGQFRTPRHIIDFIVACLDPQPGEKILDPACGTGGFLVSAYKHILAKSTSPGSSIPGDKLTHDQRQKVYANLARYDITDLMVKLSKVNLFLHGFPDPAIHIYDTLSNDARWNEKADLILANPPFMTPKGGVTPHTKFRVAAKKAEVLFTDYIAEHLSSDGRGGVIVPNGIVATTQNAYVKLRHFLVEDSLAAVVSLPAGTFKPYSGVKTNILFLDKKLARQTHEILFLKIAADGFDLGDKRSPVEANDLPEAKRVMKAWLTAAAKSEINVETALEWKIVAKSELLRHPAVTLSVERFTGVTQIDCDHPTVALRDVCSIRSGGTPSRTNEAFWTNGTIRWISSKHISEDHHAVGGEMITETAIEDSATNRIPAKSLVLITRVSVGKWAFVDESLAINQDLTALTPSDERLLPEYLKCVAPRLAAQIDSAAVGVGVRGVTREFFGSLEIPLPSLEEQRRIATEIEGYQQVITGARQILAGYVSRVEVSPDWPTVEVGEIAEFKNGVNYSKENVGIGIKVLGVRHFQSHVVAPLDDLDEINPDGVLSQGHLLENGDLIFVRSNGSKELVGRCLLVQTNGLRLTHSAFTIRMRLDRVRCEPKFYAFLLSLPEFRTQMMGGGANINNLSQDILRAIEIPLPSLVEQRKIVATLDSEAEQMEAVRSLIPRFEAKIQRVLDRVWGEDNVEVEAGLTTHFDTSAAPALESVEEKSHFKRIVLATHIINQSLEDEYFGDTKMEKLLYLSEYHCLRRNFDQHYYKQAAGPYDNKFTYGLFDYLENKSKWFVRLKKGSQYVFIPGAKHEKSKQEYDYFSEEEFGKVNRLVSLFKKWDYTKPEIVATLHAVWNNRIIKGEPVTDELLIGDFYDWDGQKKRYPIDRLGKALEWMRKQDIVPTGWGKIIERAKK